MLNKKKINIIRKKTKNKFESVSLGIKAYMWYLAEPSKTTTNEPCVKGNAIINEINTINVHM